MKAAVALMFAIGLSACGDERLSERVITSADQADAAFEGARFEAAQLIQGRVRDWRIATQAGKEVYAMASIGALDPATARDPAKVRLFVGCMNGFAESEPGHVFLADLSQHCAQAL